jgi:two-component system nitrogen regulation response regulator GlnG/two-component system response regulator HydG
MRTALSIRDTPDCTSPTLPELDVVAGGGALGRAGGAPAVWALAVIWCAEDPERVGELLIVSPSGERVFGRGGDAFAGEQPKLLLARDRPGGLERAAPLALARLSRAQVAIRPEAEGAELAVRNVGRLPMLCNGVPAAEARLGRGDVLQLGRQIAFVCVRRPAWIPPMPAEPDYPWPSFGEPDRHGIVGESPAAWEIRRQVAFIAARPGHVLVTGASGSGKELVARALHATSGRGGRPLVSRNAATFPETLIDAELFGNARNYPNAGMRERPGLVGQAAGSTLFLDEIGALPEVLQTRLLRVLDSGEYQQLGDAGLRRADFRLVAATNQPDGLRLDLAARFAFRIDLPDLNARPEDVPLLARHLLREAGQEGRGPSPELARRLVQHAYTGNVRELRSILWRCIQHARGPELEWVGAPPPPAPGPGGPAPASPPSRPVDPRTLAPAEIQACIDRERGVLERVWPKLGLRSRFALHRLIRKHRLVVERDR